MACARLNPGVPEELRCRSLVMPGGYRRHQWFMPEIGHPRLKGHFGLPSAALMRAALD
ncbi:MAG: hypothetical protein M2R46_04050 [Verrucomicrobia subdivision 3 bacterium]|nr:hypothetical protein [Limisphaerales bacterium]